MSLLNTKPKYCPDAIPTISGWVNPKTNELLVSVRNLKSRLAAERIMTKKVNRMEIKSNQEEIVKRSPGRPKGSPNKPKVIGEVVEEQKKRQIIGEVVEYDLDQRVIGE